MDLFLYLITLYFSEYSHKIIVTAQKNYSKSPTWCQYWSHKIQLLWEPIPFICLLTTNISDRCSLCSLRNSQWMSRHHLFGNSFVAFLWIWWKSSFPGFHPLYHLMSTRICRSACLWLFQKRSFSNRFFNF